MSYIPAGPGIAAAYQRKEYVWFGFYIFILILSMKVAGIGALVGSLLALEGVYRSSHDPSFSSSQKVIASLGSIVLGLVVGAAILFSIVFFYNNFSGNVLSGTPLTPVANAILQSTEATSTPFENFANPLKLAVTPYSSEKYSFRIQAPNNWIASTEDLMETVVAEFDNPSPGMLGAITVSVDPGRGSLPLKEYAAAAMHGMSQISGETAPHDVQITESHPSTLNGMPIFVVGATYSITGPDGKQYPMRMIAVFFSRGDDGYEIAGTTDEASWRIQESDILSSIASFTAPAR